MSNQEFKKFAFRILIAAVLIISGAWIVFNYFIPELYLPVLPWMLVFFSIVTILTHGYQLRIAQKDLNKFARSSMVITMLRLLLYSFFAFIYLFINNENAVVFVVCLIVVYLIYTVLETISLTRIVRKQHP